MSKVIGSTLAALGICGLISVAAFLAVIKLIPVVLAFFFLVLFFAGGTIFLNEV